MRGRFFPLLFTRFLFIFIVVIWFLLLTEKHNKMIFRFISFAAYFYTYTYINLFDCSSLFCSFRFFESNGFDVYRANFYVSELCLWCSFFPLFPLQVVVFIIAAIEMLDAAIWRCPLSKLEWYLFHLFIQQTHTQCAVHSIIKVTKHSVFRFSSHPESSRNNANNKII